MNPESLKEWHRWQAEKYIQAVNLAAVEQSVSFRKMVKDFPEECRNEDGELATMLSGRSRMSSFLELRSKFMIRNVNYFGATLVLKVGKIRTHFGYVWWEAITNPGPTPDPEYICISPTFDSRDGEYRSSFIRYDVFVAALDKAADYLSTFEQAILDLIAVRKIELSANVCPNEQSILDYIRDHRLLITPLAVTLMNTLRELDGDILMEHTGKMFVQAMTAIAKLYPSLIEVSKNYRNYANIRQATNMFRRSSPYLDSVKC